MKALKKVKLDNLLFIDIETARIVKDLEIDTPLFDSWEYKQKRNGETNEDLIQSFKKEAGLYAEFGRIVCISMGYLKEGKLAIKTYNDVDEKDLLIHFNSDLTRFTESNTNRAFCGHAAIGFDIPWIFKRCIINQVKPNALLDMAHLKPWETTVIDTKDLWKGTSFAPSSLINIAVAMGLPSPKDDISGAEVGDLYWSDEEGRIERISRYCEKDVLTTANVVMRCRFEPLLERYDEHVKTAEKESVGVINAEAYFQTGVFIEELFNGGAYGKEEKEKLATMLQELSVDEREFAFAILDSLTSTAKGKKTNINKTHVRALKASLK